jgi:hypothetical protein
VKSGTERADRMLTDPLAALKDDFEQVDDRWTVVTTIVNHETSMAMQERCYLVVLMHRERRAFCMVYKH